MKASGTRLTIDSTAEHLRQIVRDTAPGEALGNEEALLKVLGVSRATVRQAARLLEKEGLLEVRRGIQGGYFSARPNLRTIEDSVSSYLEMLDTDVKETTMIGSALWIELIRMAARSRAERNLEPLHTVYDKITSLKPTDNFNAVLQLDYELRTAILGLVNSRYVELIFHINLIFARRKLKTDPSDQDGTPFHLEFIRGWRAAKLMEIEAVLAGDPELAVIASRHSRNLWGKRIWGEDAI